VIPTDNFGIIPPSFIRSDSKEKDPFGNVPLVGIVTKSRGGYGCSDWGKNKDIKINILK
tara:strand:- start:1044 stop:1220 length:177 start_codon:yes stop_codon:yes gene_type:complete